MTISERTFQAILLADPEGRWGLHQGRLREKPPMTFGHNDVAAHLGYLLQAQLDRHHFRVRIDAGRVRFHAETHYIPDVFVVPLAHSDAFRGRPDQVEVYDRPLPLVVEVWSPATGDYDIDRKLPAYQQRGDLEIWRLHPFERTLTAWRRQPDGSYAQSLYRGGTIEVATLPGVRIDLDQLSDWT